METTLDTASAAAAVGKAEAVTLWNPTAAVLWSLLFTPALGAWLVMRNWERLGKPDKARHARWWFAGMFCICLASYIAAAAGALLGREDLAAPWWSGLVLCGIWCVLSAYPQISHVDDHHGETYARRSWAAPLLIALAANCAIPFAAGVVAGFQAAAAY